jgi:hypothetical protein
MQDSLVFCICHASQWQRKACVSLLQLLDGLRYMFGNKEGVHIQYTLEQMWNVRKRIQPTPAKLAKLRSHNGLNQKIPIW